jgi:hypothetical protein
MPDSNRPTEGHHASRKLNPLLAEHPGLIPVQWQSVMLARENGRAIVLTDVLSAMN